MYICLWETMMQYFEIIEVYVFSCVCVCVFVCKSVWVSLYFPHDNWKFVGLDSEKISARITKRVDGWKLFNVTKLAN